MGNCASREGALPAEVTELQAQLRALQEQLTAANGEVAKVKAEMGSRLEARDAEVDKLKAQLVDAEERLNNAPPGALDRSLAPGPQSPGGAKPDLSTAKFPSVGDHVVSYHHPTTAFYTSTVASFDSESYKYTVNWDDKDPTGREMNFDEVALDIAPSADEVAAGSLVIFPQGKYVGTAGNNDGGTRYHKGKVTRVYSAGGKTLYDGHHTETPETGKHRFRAYVFEFTGLELSQLRVAPNVLDILSNDSQTQSSLSGSQSYDVFLAYNKLDSFSALRNHEVQDPPSYQSLLQEHTDPRRIKQSLANKGFNVWIDTDQPSNFNYRDMSVALQQSKVVVACVSNAFADSHDNRMQFQYAIKTLRKPVIAVVVEKYEQGPPWDWQTSVVGLLLAGELYVDFTDIANEQSKLAELCGNISRIIEGDGGGAEATLSRSISEKPPEAADVFVSYCWSNSFDAKTQGQIEKLAGTKHSDPRFAAKKLEESGFSTWLDVKRLGSGQQGLFDQIAEGLKGAKVVVAFVSAEYARSDNCRMEFQFACKSLRKPIIPVIVGDSDAWEDTVVGMLVRSLDIDTRDLRAADAGAFQTVFEEIVDLSKEKTGVDAQAVAPSAEPEVTFKAPAPGHHVIAYHHPTRFFYLATIVSFDKHKFEYTVRWDDGDPSGKTMKFDEVAFDSPPAADEVSVGSRVVFAQGRYVGTDGNNEGGYRYHEGVITRVYDKDGVTMYDGHHVGPPDQAPRFRAFVYNFTLPLAALRVPPNAMDAIMAQQAQS